MNDSYSQTQTSIDLAQIVAKARDAERSRDLEGLKSLLEPIWENFEKKPDFGDIDPEIRGGLLRACGYYLNTFGASQQLKGYAELAKELITEAANVYESLGLTDEVGLAKVLLSATYLDQGRFEEQEVILNEVAAQYENDQLHHVNLMVSATKMLALLWKNDFQAIREVLEDLRIPIELCEDSFLLHRYHNNAGIYLARVGDYVESRFHYERAVFYGRKLNNPRYFGSSINNLAMNYCRQGDIEAANGCIEEVIEIYTELNDDGLIAVAFDTKSQICLKANDYENGLSYIDKSIKLFSRGDNFSKLTDAMWIKVHLLLSAARKKEAIMLFCEISEIAKREIGDYAVQKYAGEFEKIIHVRKGLALSEEVSAFKRELLTESLNETDADIHQTADNLKTDEKELVHVLTREFPEICLEFGMSTKAMSTADN